MGNDIAGGLRLSVFLQRASNECDMGYLVAESAKAVNLPCSKRCRFPVFLAQFLCNPGP